MEHLEEPQKHCLNGKQMDGRVDDLLTRGDLKAKFEAFGWQVMNIRKHTSQKKPVIILMKAEVGMGVDYMMGAHKWHGVAPSNEQLEKALEQMEEPPADY